MFRARTAWAIALLLAPTGVAAAGAVSTVTAPAEHTAFVEIVISGDERTSDLATVEAHVACGDRDTVQAALEWMAGTRTCEAPAGSAVYVSRAGAPSPIEQGGLVPTGIVYAHEDADGVWMVREYTYGRPGGETYHAYVLSPEISPGDEAGSSGETVRGVVNLTKLDVGPGQQASLETKLGPGPQLTPEDPTIERVETEATPSIGTTTRGLRG